jgi:hypothetical protein
MGPFEYSVAGNVVPSLLYILPHAAKHVFVINPGGLKEGDEIVDGKMAIRAAMCLPGPRAGVVQDPLARVGRIASTSSVSVTTHVTIGVADIVFVFRVELVISVSSEPLAPEDETVF